MDIIVRKNFDRSDPLWDQAPSVGEEGLIATVDNKSLTEVLADMLGRQRKALSR
jgi:hypothetical protein